MIYYYWIAVNETYYEEFLTTIPAGDYVDNFDYAQQLFPDCKISYYSTFFSEKSVKKINKKIYQPW